MEEWAPVELGNLTVWNDSNQQRLSGEQEKTRDAVGTKKRAEK
jgi:hypothetical protein